MKKIFFFTLLVFLIVIFGWYSSPVNAQTALERLKVGTFNVKNLDPSDGDRFNKIAEIITNDLGNPDILALVEMQDNNGAVNDNVVIATETFTTLTDAIQNQGGPSYKFTEIDPNGESSVTTKPNSDVEDYNESISDLFEPRESIKGDIARAIFYFYTVHKSQADESFFTQQKQDLCNWNKKDLPSSGEIKRSHAIAQLQGNENPFVIDPTLADRAYCS